MPLEILEIHSTAQARKICLAGAGTCHFSWQAQGKPRVLVVQKVDFSWQAQGIGAALLRSADFVAGAALWTWWWFLRRSDFVTGAVKRDFWTCGSFAGFVAGAALCEPRKVHGRLGSVRFGWRMLRYFSINIADMFWDRFGSPWFIENAFGFLGAGGPQIGLA